MSTIEAPFKDGENLPTRYSLETYFAYDPDATGTPTDGMSVEEFILKQEAEGWYNPERVCVFDSLRETVIVDGKERTTEVARLNPSIVWIDATVYSVEDLRNHLQPKIYGEYEDLILRLLAEETTHVVISNSHLIYPFYPERGDRILLNGHIDRQRVE